MKTFVLLSEKMEAWKKAKEKSFPGLDAEEAILSEENP